MLTLRYNFDIPIAAGTFGIRAFTSPDAITPLLYWEDNKLITTILIYAIRNCCLWTHIPRMAPLIRLLEQKISVLSTDSGS